MTSIATLTRPASIPGARIRKREDGKLEVCLDCPRLEIEYQVQNDDAYDHDVVEALGAKLCRSYMLATHEIDLGSRVGQQLVPLVNLNERSATYFLRVFDAELVHLFPASLKEPPSALMSTHSLLRNCSGTGLTWVHESIDVRRGGWPLVTALYLEEAFKFHVRCSEYESSNGDISLHPHFDAWFGCIVQLDGEKLWTVWNSLEQSPRQILTRPGDVLMIPPTVKHYVTTPYSSTHLVFAILATRPLSAPIT